MAEEDEYIKDVIAKGGEGSALLNAITVPTLKNCKYIDILEHLAVLRPPKDHLVVVHSAGGDPKQTHIVKHTLSMVKELIDQAEEIGAKPQALADVVDSNSGDISLIDTIGNSLKDIADHYKLAIMNGENAILGPRVNCDANVSGTMISIAEKGKLNPGIFTPNEVTYAVFDPQGKAVFINSDGVGTKTEFYERAGMWSRALRDSLAMKNDDTIKWGATARVVSDVVETKGNVPFEELRAEALKLGKQMGFDYILQHEILGNRLRGYNDTVPCFNISGSTVSTIDEQRLRNPPKPSAGEYLIAIRGIANPRSNGISSKRKIMVSLLGENWHETKKGKEFLEYLAQPSIVFYPVFKELLDAGIATSFYHMSGGAFNGKLAKPLAKHGLFARVDDLFKPDYRELALKAESKTSTTDAYGQWPMGNDGFVTAIEKNKDRVIEALERMGLEARVVAQLKPAENGITGVELKAYDGTKVYFPGIEKAA